MNCLTQYDGRVPTDISVHNIKASRFLCVAPRFVGCQADLDLANMGTANVGTLIVDTIQAESTCTNKVKELIPGAGVFIDKPLFGNIHGVGKVWLNDDGAIKISGNDFVVFPVLVWDLNFESQGAGPPLLLQGGHLLTIPPLNGYLNECVEDWCVCIKVHLQITVIWDHDAGSSVWGIQLIKNGLPWSIAITGSSVPLGTNSASTLQITDVLKCLPGDQIDMAIFTEMGFSDSVLLLPSFVGILFTGVGPAGVQGLSYFTYEILGFDTTGVCTNNPPSS